jgi:hypothetical protein
MNKKNISELNYFRWSKNWEKCVIILNKNLFKKQTLKTLLKQKMNLEKKEILKNLKYWALQVLHKMNHLYGLKKH